MNRLKTFTILSILVFILASIFIYPNFNSKLPTWWKYAFPDNRLNLGLDLKGGINVILQISVKDILQNLSNNSSNPVFNKALDDAEELQKNSQNSYLEDFLSFIQKVILHPLHTE